MDDEALQAKIILPELFKGTSKIQAFKTQLELLSSLQNLLKKQSIVMVLRNKTPVVFSFILISARPIFLSDYKAQLLNFISH